MNLIIEELKKALDNQCYLSALTLALTIPDICGQLEYPEITGHGSTGKRYKKWFNEYVKQYFMTDNLVLFDSNDCYDLRNAILHSGQSYKTSRIQKFRLALPEGPIPVQRCCDYSTKDKKDLRISIDIKQLSWCIGRGMSQWLSETNKNTENLKLLTFFRVDDFFERQ